MHHIYVIVDFLYISTLINELKKYKKPGRSEPYYTVPGKDELEDNKLKMDEIKLLRGANQSLREQRTMFRRI